MNQVQSASSSPRDIILHGIESLVQNLFQELEREQILSIPLRTRYSQRSQQRRDSSRNYCFPAPSYQSAWRFTVVLAILNIIHDCVSSGRTVSKRDIYYQDPDLFRTQAVVDKYVDDIAYTFGVSRSDLNVAAEARGSLAGPLSIHCDNGALNTAFADDPEGIPVTIPSQHYKLSVSSSQKPRFLLLVEKRATFHTLSRALFHRLHHCLLLTGQGYPDLATRSFLHYFHSILAPDTPCFALTDLDPDGLYIYNVYMNGSMALAHEDNVAVPDLKFLGLCMDDALSTLNETQDRLMYSADEEEDTSRTRVTESINLPYLSARERQRGKGLLKRLTAQEDGNTVDEQGRAYMLERWGWQQPQISGQDGSNMKKLKHEVQICLMVGYKIELQILDRRSGGLEAWITEKLQALGLA